MSSRLSQAGRPESALGAESQIRRLVPRRRLVDDAHTYLVTLANGGAQCHAPIHRVAASRRGRDSCILRSSTVSAQPDSFSRT
jgi:hypothetical protein